MKRLMLATVFVFPLFLFAAGFGSAADDSKVKEATGHVESGAKKIHEGKIGEGVEETAKGVGHTVTEGAKYSGEKVKEAGKAAEPPAKSAWGTREIAPSGSERASSAFLRISFEQLFSFIIEGDATVIGLI